MEVRALVQFGEATEVQEAVDVSDFDVGRTAPARVQTLRAVKDGHDARLEKNA